jgi:hypothetical protein
MHRLLDADAAQGEQPPDDLRQIEPLGDAEPELGDRLGGFRAPQPAPAGEAALDAENGGRRLRRGPGRGESAQRPKPATNA